MDDLKLLKVLWEESISGLAKVSKEGRFVAANPRFCEITEYVEPELVNRNFKEITHPEDASDDWEMVKRCVAGDLKGYTMTKRYITKSGKIVWVKLKVIVIDPEDEHVYFLAQVLNINNDTLKVIAEEPALSLSMQTKVYKFIKENWRFLSIVITGIVGASYEFYHNWLTLQESIANQQIQIGELTRLLQSLKEK